MTSSLSAQSHIDALIASTGAPDALSAIRLKAREAIELYRRLLGEPTMPFNVVALASLLGIGMDDEAPSHSKDAELIPVGGGRVSIRVNREQPETRQRFSVGHEVTHTFFPDYHKKAWCRTDARFRRRDQPEDYIEMLCDVGSAELLMALPQFADDVDRVMTGEDLIDLSLRYGVSREATLRRFAEIHPRPLTAVFFSWKLKPTQERRINTNQRSLFEIGESLPQKKLRVDYSIPSPAFSATGHYLPADKSVECDGPLYEAASTGRPCQGKCRLNMGTERGTYSVLAIPLWTDDQNVGPEGENAVAAIIEPVDVVLARAPARR
jgi:hypothetical protein